MKKIWFLTTLLVAGLLLTGCFEKVQDYLLWDAACTKIINNCWDDCINESDIDVLEHKCMEYVNNAMFYNIEASASRTNHYFYDNSWSMEYTFTDAEFSWTYYWIKWYVKAWDISSNFICNIYTGWLLHGLHFYNDKSNNEEPIEECKRYFDWCNRCTLQDDWERICTEEACEQYQEPYCWDEQYNQFLENIKSSWEQPQGKNILVATEEPMDLSHVINLKIWDKSFEVTLEDNTATKALLEKLKEWDIVVNAQEYWWFEKVWNLGFDLPRADKQITTEPGDLVLYQWNQISLFYESNSWSYTKLWKVQMISKDGLKEILWDWDVKLIFSLVK